MKKKLKDPGTNNLEKYVNIFDVIKPWSGKAPDGFLVDFLGAKTDLKFRKIWGEDPTSWGSQIVRNRCPIVSDGEGWFEAVNWLLAAMEAKGRFTMVTLGACYGVQAVGSYLTLQQVNPLPCRLVAVEANPEDCDWTKSYFVDNGIDPDDHWILNAAVSNTNKVVYFPVGATGSGTQNCVGTNEELSRQIYANELISSGRSDEALRNLLLNNSTGIKKDLAPGSGYDFEGEIQCVSAVTLKDIISPFDKVDLLESDIQQSEIIVFPPAIDLLRKKVKRIHIGTHGIEVHEELRNLFKAKGWIIIFDFSPDSKFNTEFGSFETSDGVLTVVNPDL